MGKFGDLFFCEICWGSDLQILKAPVLNSYIIFHVFLISVVKWKLHPLSKNKIKKKKIKNSLLIPQQGKKYYTFVSCPILAQKQLLEQRLKLERQWLCFRLPSLAVNIPDNFQTMQTSFPIQTVLQEWKKETKNKNPKILPICQSTLYNLAQLLLAAAALTFQIKGNIDIRKESKLQGSQYRHLPSSIQKLMRSGPYF